MACKEIRASTLYTCWKASSLHIAQKGNAIPSPNVEYNRTVDTASHFGSEGLANMNNQDVQELFRGETLSEETLMELIANSAWNASEDGKLWKGKQWIHYKFKFRCCTRGQKGFGQTIKILLHIQSDNAEDAISDEDFQLLLLHIILMYDVLILKTLQQTFFFLYEDIYQRTIFPLYLRT